MTRSRISRAALALSTVLVLLVAPSARAQSPATSVEASKLFDVLALAPGEAVGEIGAGNGELTIDAARLVGATGKVLASELGDNSVSRLQAAVTRSRLPQITVVAGDPNRTNFPDRCCDAVFMRNVYHHFADPSRMNASIFRSLKPGGRVAVVDFEPNRGRSEAARPADRAHNDSHGVSPASVARELKEAGFEILRTEPGADRWFMVVAAKPRQ